jgi:ATP-dependent RNA helicase RhlE
VQFNDLPLSEPLLRAVREEGFRHPTALQRSAIPAILDGRDLIVTAQTGTGKTAAYALPILERLHSAKPTPEPTVLVLAATRDVVRQIGETFELLGRYTDQRAVALVQSEGGAAGQEEALREGREILIATPDRLLDLVDLNLVHLGAIRLFVLDEVEDMDKLGLLGSAARIASLMPTRPQTLLFSAEMSEAIQALAADLLNNPLPFEAAPRTPLTVSHVDQRVIYTPRGAKSALIKQLLADPALARVLVYLRSRRAAQKLQRQLKSSGVDAELGRAARVQIVTDGAARRVKINELTHVINYDVPVEVEVYVHRVGRSVRAGSEAIAITFCDEEERASLAEIESTLRMSFTVLDNPLPPDAIPAQSEPRPQPDSRPPQPRDDNRPPREARPERPPREDRRDDSRSSRPDRGDRSERRGRAYEDETPPAATITFVSAPHPQVKKTMEEWFAEREQRSPLEDAAVAAYLLEHPELAPKKPQPSRKHNTESRRDRPAEGRGRNDGDRKGDGGRKRRRVRGGQRRGNRRGASGDASSSSAGS